ncbi:hypothetical protein WH8501_13745 [Crocosphaera watsonii WH 8501]|uniref:Uncharacterized protein n=1 Tax=Crocosphaera watsonii WH 8501 TaxID=165597 RepID=Q4C4G5_CROWT|nr:hypothetical protein [Crocosphaera watsonii]EAM51061.1 hypothetical protein CwatDRAFT_4103 [Crocosphaera watsonii WH 8501]
MICTNKRQNQAIITSLVSSACLAALTFGFSEKASAAATVWGGNGAITSITDGGNYRYEGRLNSSRLINGLTGNAANNNPEFLTKSAIAKHRSLTGSGFEQSDRRFPQPTVCCQILS